MVTPVGQVKVTGTCFRVEIIMSPTKHALLGGALGAVVATAAVVTVYEGKIIVVGDRGTQVASAGERTTLRFVALIPQQVTRPFYFSPFFLPAPLPRLSVRRGHESSSK